MKINKILKNKKIEIYAKLETCKLKLARLEKELEKNKSNETLEATNTFINAWGLQNIDIEVINKCKKAQMEEIKKHIETLEDELVFIMLIYDQK